MANDSSPYVVLRDTISKQVREYSRAEADQWLNHPVFGLRLEEVNTAKPEKLSSPFVFDGQGNKHAIEDEAPAEETATDGELVEDYSDVRWTKDELLAEISRRNEGRAEDNLIDNAGNKPDLIAALQADDAAEKETD